MSQRITHFQRMCLMPWQAKSIMSEREEFLVLAAGSNMTRLCERFGISQETGHVWLRRYSAGGAAALGDRSRRPRSSPGKTDDVMESLIVEIRRRHPAWGGRKIKARLEHLGHVGVPAASTVTAVLRRHGLITAEASAAATPWIRFEHPRPNDLWQMDFKGPIATRSAACHALTATDDHSRFALCVRACRDQQGTTVKHKLTRMFERYGLPWRILADNGAPWGVDDSGAWTRLEVWLLKLGVVMVHGRPRSRFWEVCGYMYL